MLSCSQALMSRTFSFLQNDTKMNVFDEGIPVECASDRLCTPFRSILGLRPHSRRPFPPSSFSQPFTFARNRLLLHSLTILDLLSSVLRFRSGPLFSSPGRRFQRQKSGVVQVKGAGQFLDVLSYYENDNGTFTF